MFIDSTTPRGTPSSYRGIAFPRQFQDRRDAGRQLAALLTGYRDRHPFVIALPRGGVPVGYEIARALGAPLDVLPVRKIGAPGHREYGIGAIAPGGAFVLNMAAVNSLGVTRAEIEAVVAEETAELERRMRLYRGDRPLPDLGGRTAILVDDGLATGMTALAAIRAVRQSHPERIVLAAPVCAPETAAELRAEVDDLVCVSLPDQFYAVGLWYRSFEQTTDEEVLALLRDARERPPAAPTAPAGTPRRP
jgi:predicted phosphoribosyltransferase